MNQFNSLITLGQFSTFLFDLDGVLTATAKIHAACWKQTFDRFLKQQAEENNEPFVPFDLETDYKRYVDGKMRYVGTQSFLKSREIHLPYGEVVSQKLVGGKVDKSNFAFSSFDVYSCSV